jgi:hypothetical protein
MHNLMFFSNPLKTYSPKKVIDPKLLHTVIKVTNFIFHHFFGDTFFVRYALYLFHRLQLIRKQHKVLHFWLSHIESLRENVFAHISNYRQL